MTGTLTARERQVLKLIANGRSTKQLAAELGIKFKTAACHRYRLLEKVGASNSAELISLAIRTGLLDLSGNGTAAKPDGNERAARVCEESRRDRALLSEALKRSAQLQEECRRAREEFRVAREELSRNCRTLLKYAGKIVMPAGRTTDVRFVPATSDGTPPRRFPPSTPRAAERLPAP